MSLTIGNLEIQTEQFRVLVDGRDVQLTYFEFEILSTLAHEANRVIARDELARRIWPLQSVRVHDRRIDIHLARIRRKLMGASCGIETVRRRGYVLTTNRAEEVAVKAS